MNRRIPIRTLLVLTLILTGLAVSAAVVSAADATRGLAGPANLLPAELRNAAVEDRFLPATTQEAGVLQTVVGPVVVARGDLSRAYWAAGGDKLYEQDVLFTLKEGKCRVKLVNDDVITLADQTRLALKAASGSRTTSEKKSVLALARGKAMFYAIRLFNHKRADMTVESPTAVTGVRGTKFGVEVSLQEDARAARPLLLADASPDWARHLVLAQAGPQPQAATVVHGFEGTVVVTSTVDGRTQSVGAGQSLSTTPQGIGQVMPTPPQVAQSFQAATNVPPPAANGQGGASSGGATSGGQQPAQQQSQSSSSGGSAPPPATTTTTATTPPVVDTSSITQQQTTTQTEKAQADPVTDPKTNASGNHVGYFAGILTNLGTQGPQDVYVSQNRYDGDGNVWGRGIKNAEDYLRVNGSSGSGKFGEPILKWAKVFEKSSGALENAVSHTQLGTYNTNSEYMEWGYATIPTFTVDGQKYAVDNRAYWIFGKTPEAGLSVSGSYSGNVNGTYWTSGGGVNMTGTFSCMVNLSGGSGAVNNFNLSASGTNVSVGITGASGNIGSDAHFRLSGGTWDLKGTPAEKTGASGSLYGPTATGIGGVWGMSNSSNSAAGVFHGSGPGAVH